MHTLQEILGTSSGWISKLRGVLFQLSQSLRLPYCEVTEVRWTGFPRCAFEPAFQKAPNPPRMEAKNTWEIKL
ncbi:hypothetical protein CEXT_326721 [Caerostris extrusa]|uniref:Uncharacterized protein n=1 Tax=Caerostris extrusa TaxID=172846 RepID=A0AAV4W1Y9_CAEEX|nr:hypothetical protein CEXT_326721 [Caerostris extrusa]